jgi:hypothetical protein
MLIVEGPTDEALLGTMCEHGQGQVWAAGTRKLVETLLVYLRANPIEGCECIYLTDCDGRGKLAQLRRESRLIVTGACDSEADLVLLGVAQRAVEMLIADDDVDVLRLVAHAQAIALPLSVVRRRAATARVSMKSDQRMLRFDDLPTTTTDSWLDTPPTINAALAAVAIELRWTPDEKVRVRLAEPQGNPDFGRHCLGKDAIDVLWLLLTTRGPALGITKDEFYRRIRGALQRDDLRTWVVGQRVSKWQAESGLNLVPGL